MPQASQNAQESEKAPIKSIPKLDNSRLVLKALEQKEKSKEPLFPWERAKQLRGQNLDAEASVRLF